jgi:hypothetical protein
MDETLTLEQQQALALAKARRRRAEAEAKVTAAPAPAQEEQSIARQVRNLLGPTIEGVGAVGGGLLGTALGPAGTVGGAGLGYGIAKGGLRLLDQAAGWEAPQTAGNALATSAQDVLTGATFEAGGRVAAPYIAKYVGAPIARAYGAVKDKFSSNRAAVKAGQIARDALGPDLPAVRNALQEAPEGMTAAQASANVNSPTWQALAQNAGKHDPRFFGAGPLTPTQEAASFNALAGIAGGDTQAAAIASRAADKAALNARLGPVRQVELDAANTAGNLLPRLQGEANRMGEAAASKVEDVRRFVAAGDRAGGRANYTTLDANGNPVAAVTAVPGYPRQPGRYTYMGELEKKAEQVATGAAADSLPLGEAARFAQMRADSLASHGLKPLTPELVEAGIARTLREPSLAGNKDIERVMRSVGDEISKWTKANGVIDAEALYSIRKNAVKTAVNSLGQGMEPAAQKALASDVSNRLSPLIDNAIENAGGTGWKKYLADYAAGRQVIDQKKLGAEALAILKANPKGFVDLVEGNSPDLVNKIFSGARDSYILGAQMDPSKMGTLSSIADLTRRGLRAGEQATAGQTGFSDVMAKDAATFQLPNPLDPRIAITNKAFRYLQQKFGVNAMEQLTAGMRSGKSAQEMLAVLPSKERVLLLRAMQQPELWSVPGAAVATGNALGMTP